MRCGTCICSIQEICLFRSSSWLSNCKSSNSTLINGNISNTNCRFGLIFNNSNFCWIVCNDCISSVWYYNRKFTISATKYIVIYKINTNWFWALTWLKVYNSRSSFKKRGVLIGSLSFIVKTNSFTRNFTEIKFNNCSACILRYTKIFR